MAQLSELVRLFTRSSQPRGMIRLATGSTGSRRFQSRNSDAGASAERAALQSPVFRAFLDRMAWFTPISDYLARRKL